MLWRIGVGVRIVVVALVIGGCVTGCVGGDGTVAVDFELVIAGDVPQSVHSR